MTSAYKAVFEFSEEETPEIIEEFYPAATDDDVGGAANEATNKSVVNQKPTLKDKLDRKVALVSQMLYDPCFDGFASADLSKVWGYFFCVKLIYRVCKIILVYFCGGSKSPSR